MKKILMLLFIPALSWSQTLSQLTVEKIMRDPKWIGVSPSNISWSDDSKQVYFLWNPEKLSGDSLYFITPLNPLPSKVSPGIRRQLPSNFGSYNSQRTKKTYEKNGDIFLLDIPTNKVVQITNSVDRESNPAFSFDE